MTIAPPMRLQNVKGGQWRIALRSRVNQSRTDLDSAALDETHRTKAVGYLEQVSTLIEDRQTPAEWWSGSQVEQAWNQMRSAQQESVESETDLDRIIANGRTILGKAKGRLADDNSLVAALTDAIAKAKPPNGGHAPNGAEATIRHLTVEVARAYADVSNAEHQAQRQTRNILLVLDVILGGLALVLIALGMRDYPLPGFITAPEGLSTGGAIAAALGLGALGALFSAIPSLATAPTNSTTYNPRSQQALFKVVIGAWSALVGLVAVAASAVQASGDSPSRQTLAGFIILCLGFGATQEALTRFADRKATDTKPSTT